MDIFEVLSAILTKKDEFILTGMNEHEALTKATYDISEEYHIPLLHIEKLVGNIAISGS
jgi:hypothetical protein